MYQREVRDSFMDRKLLTPRERDETRPDPVAEAADQETDQARAHGTSRWMIQRKFAPADKRSSSTPLVSGGRRPPIGRLSARQPLVATTGEALPTAETPESQERDEYAREDEEEARRQEQEDAAAEVEADPEIVALRNAIAAKAAEVRRKAEQLPDELRAAVVQVAINVVRASCTTVGPYPETLRWELTVLHALVEAFAWFMDELVANLLLHGTDQSYWGADWFTRVLVQTVLIIATLVLSDPEGARAQLDGLKAQLDQIKNRARDAVTGAVDQTGDVIRNVVGRLPHP
jgi:hypothetical protein